MATESVATEHPGAWYLPFDDINRANDVAHKLRSVVECIRSASLSRDNLKDDAIAGACWTATDLVDELEAIATMHRPAAAASDERERACSMNAKTTTTDARIQVTLEPEAVEDIREMLLVGLIAYGTFLEQNNACEVAKLCNRPWPDEACPIDPWGMSDTVSQFAGALMALHIAECAARDRALEETDA